MVFILNHAPREIALHAMKTVRVVTAIFHLFVTSCASMFFPSNSWLYAGAPMAWDRTRLSARGFLDVSPKRDGFTCLRTRLSFALKSSSQEKISNLSIGTDINES